LTLRTVRYESTVTANERLCVAVQGEADEELVEPRPVVINETLLLRGAAKVLRNLSASGLVRMRIRRLRM
jgi:hypothetical protein